MLDHAGGFARRHLPLPRPMDAALLRGGVAALPRTFARWSDVISATTQTARTSGGNGVHQAGFRRQKPAPIRHADAAL